MGKGEGEDGEGSKEVKPPRADSSYRLLAPPPPAPPAPPSYVSSSCSWPLAWGSVQEDDEFGLEVTEVTLDQDL